MRFFTAIAAILAITPTLCTPDPALLSSSAGTLDRNDGVRAFIDANGNGTYDFGEKLVTGLDISLNFCSPTDDGSESYDCDQNVYGDELTTPLRSVHSAGSQNSVSKCREISASSGVTTYLAHHSRTHR